MLRFVRQAYCYRTYKCIALQIAVLLFVGCVPVFSQGNLSIKDVNLNTISRGQTIYSNPATNQWPMPLIYIGVSGAPDCSPVSMSLVVQYQDQGGRGTNYSASHNMAACDTWTLGWPQGVVEGGTVTVTYSTSAGPFEATQFYIAGLNASESVVDQQYGGAPWFLPNMIMQESGGRQFCTSAGGAGCNPPASGYPVNNTSADGIGLMQTDAVAQPIPDSAYWSYLSNIGEGEIILQTKQSAAYSFWSSQVSQMQSQTSPNYVYPNAANFPYCNFAYPQGSAHSFQDAEWIKAYNGAAAYYIAWEPATNGNPGYWRQDGSVGYVSAVCNAASY